jgi:hypothetical protein
MSNESAHKADNDRGDAAVGWTSGGGDPAAIKAGLETSRGKTKRANCLEEESDIMNLT